MLTYGSGSPPASRVVPLISAVPDARRLLWGETSDRSAVLLLVGRTQDQRRCGLGRDLTRVGVRSDLVGHQTDRARWRVKVSSNGSPVQAICEQRSAATRHVPGSQPLFSLNSDPDQNKGHASTIFVVAYYVDIPLSFSIQFYSLPHQNFEKMPKILPG